MREPDAIWDELDACFGPVRTKAERGRRNVAVKQLKDAGATPEEVGIAYAWCSRSFTIFTEMAIVSHFGRALHEHVESGANVVDLEKLRRMAGGS